MKDKSIMKLKRKASADALEKKTLRQKLQRLEQRLVRSQQASMNKQAQDLDEAKQALQIDRTKGGKQLSLQGTLALAIRLTSALFCLKTYHGLLCQGQKDVLALHWLHLLVCFTRQCMKISSILMAVFMWPFTPTVRMPQMPAFCVEANLQHLSCIAHTYVTALKILKMLRMAIFHVHVMSGHLMIGLRVSFVWQTFYQSKLRTASQRFHKPSNTCKASAASHGRMYNKKRRKRSVIWTDPIPCSGSLAIVYCGSGVRLT